MAKLILGCGYLGGRVARRWLAASETVYALTRSPERAQRLEQEGIRPLVGDVTRPETLSGFPVAQTVLYAIGYDRQCGASRSAIHVEGLRAVLGALSPETGRIVYVSTTGVYGSAALGWVDEDSPCEPTREAGRAILAAEQVLRAHPLAERAVILRLAGLYGPGRIPLMADLVAGRPIVAGAEQRLNLIHVEDAVSAILAAESQAHPPRIINISDGHPTARQEFYRHLAKLKDLPPPSFSEPSPDQAESARAGQKNVSNTRMLAELRFPLAYPSYREGLAAMASEAN